ncbi:MAG: BrnT family toxin [Thermoanaerobaculia bacterium]
MSATCAPVVTRFDCELNATTFCISTFEDDRFSCGEQRFVTLGLLAGIPVSIAHTENDHEIRVISFRKATRREAHIYSHAIQD